MNVPLPQPRTDGGPGVEIAGLDIRQIGDADARFLKDLVYRDRVVVLRGDTAPAPADFIAFARRLGAPQVYPIDSYHHPEHPELYISSNISKNGKRYGVARTGYYWHTDCCFLSEPVSLTMLAMEVLPAGPRETLFIDMVEVLDALPPALRGRLEQRAAWHGPNGRYKVREADVGKPLHELLDEIGRLSPDVRHPCVIAHPATGERALYVNEGFTTRVEGLSPEDSRDLLAAVFAFTRESHRIRAHLWQPGDIVLWDNRTVVHRSGAVPSAEDYVVFRISIFDGLPFYAKSE